MARKCGLKSPIKGISFVGLIIYNIKIKTASPKCIRQVIATDESGYVVNIEVINDLKLLPLNG